VIERNIKLARLEVRRICSRSCGIDLEIIGFVLCDEIQEGAAKVGQKSVVLLLYGIGENVIFLEEMAVIDIECGELVLAHGVDLFDIDELAIRSLRKIAIRCRSGC